MNGPASLQQPPRAFVRGFSVLVLLCALLATAVFLFFPGASGSKPDAGVLRLAASGAICIRLLLFLWRRRGLAAEAGKALWGAANLLTLLRGLLIAFLAGFLFAPRPAGLLTAWLPALAYTAVACLDFLDGTVARRTATLTRLGGALDQELDGLGLLIAFLLVVQYHVLPPPLLLPGLAHYLFAFGLWLRRRRGLAVRPLPPDRWRRRLAGFQMALAAVFLWPIARPGPALLAESLIGLPFLLGFGRDWLLVSGRLNPDAAPAVRRRTLLKTWLEARLPLLLRAACLLLGLAAVWAAIGGGTVAPVWRGLLPSPAGPIAARAAAWLTALALLGLAAGRGLPFFAMTVIVLAGLPLYLAGMTLIGGLQLCCALLLLLLGAGPRLSELRGRPG
jgi:CDP-diacylglycerol--glycerol-3-phosphate 3-phosphatidyltransferase